MLRRDFVKAGILVPSLGLLGKPSEPKGFSEFYTEPNVIHYVDESLEHKYLKVKQDHTRNSHVFPVKSDSGFVSFEVYNRATRETKPVILSCASECSATRTDNIKEPPDVNEAKIRQKCRKYKGEKITLVMKTFIYSNTYGFTYWNAIIEHGDELLFESDLLLNKV